jgi:WD40 repeat protein
MFVTLCLLFGLMMYLSLPFTYGAELRMQPYYVVDAYQTPGGVYRIVNSKSSVFFRRESDSISSIALCNRQLFFCSAKDKRIYQKMGREERVVFEHNTFIQDISVDSGGNLYFSVAYGANGDGRIYKLTPSVNQVGDDGFSPQSNQPFYAVRLNTVDGFWAGNFAFDEQGNLYLGSGNRLPAFIYRLDKIKGNQYKPPRKIYKDAENAIKGIAMEPTNMNFAYYVDWKQTIHKVNLRYSIHSVEHSENIAGSRNPHLSDVAFDVRIRRR